MPGNAVPKSMPGHFSRHVRFYVSLSVGLLTWLASELLHLPLHISLAGNAFFVLYLVSMALIARSATPELLRRRAASRDEGIFLIVLITLAAIAISLGSIFALLNAAQKPDLQGLISAIVSVPLGWTTLHTIMAFHYAHLFYSRHPAKKSADAGGLGFPNCSEPGGWDFLYFSFVIGMTAQTSDVQVLSTELRRLTLIHAVVSFFYNTVILALAVNLAIDLRR